MRTWWLVLLVVSQVVAKQPLCRMLEKAQCMSSCYNKAEASQCIATDCKYTKYRHKTDWKSCATRVQSPGPTELRLLCRDESRLVMEWTMSADHPQTPVFVLELQSRLDSRWYVIGTPTPYPQLEVANLTSSMEYRFRVRAVVETGQLGEPTESAWISTLSDLYAPQQVSNVRLVRTFTVEAGKLATDVLWDPAEDRTCFYQVHLLKTPSPHFWYDIKQSKIPSCRLRAEPKNKTFDCPYQFQLHLDSMLYDTDYTIHVVSMSKDLDGNHRESPKANLTFRSPKCAAVNPLDTTACPPAAAASGTRLNVGALVHWPQQLKDPATTHQKHKVVVAVSGVENWVNIDKIPPAHDKSSVQIGYNIQGDIPGDNGHHLVNYMATSAGSILGLLTIAGVVFTIQRFYKRGCAPEVKSCQKAENLPMKELPGPKMTQPVKDEWSIAAGRLTLGDQLGEGAFGVVYKGLLKLGDGETPREVAVKMTRGNPTSKEAREFQREIEIMKAIGAHPHVVSIIGSSIVASNLLLITEYCSLGDLQKFLRQEWDRRESLSQHRPDCPSKDLGSIQGPRLLEFDGDGSWCECPLRPSWPDVVTNRMYVLHNGDLPEPMIQQLTASDLISFARQIAMGMEFLSKNHVVHRDLAARNVLVCSNRTVKISDFGLSRDVYSHSMYFQKTNVKLPIKWMALESLMFQVYTTKSDVWSFGVLLWEIVTLGRVPYPNRQSTNVLPLLQAGHRMECPKTCSKHLYEIMVACWEEKPNNRPTFTELHSRLDVLLTSATHHQYLNLELLSSSSDGTVPSFTKSRYNVLSTDF